MIFPASSEKELKEMGIPAYRAYDSVPSTNTRALEWLQQGGEDQSIVFADHQSAGRGRHERHWITTAQSAIAVSIILRPAENEKQNIQLFSALTGVACALTLQNDYKIKAVIKWPNDVLIDAQKTAGILVEADWSGDKLNGLVIGIGINISPESIPAADLLRFPATCIQNHTNRPIDRFDFMVNFLRNFITWRSKINSTEFINQWEKLLAFRGETVYINENKTTLLRGKLLGVESNGNLRLITSQGETLSISAGDVHLRPAKQQWEDQYDR